MLQFELVLHFEPPHGLMAELRDLRVLKVQAEDVEDEESR